MTPEELLAERADGAGEAVHDVRATDRLDDENTLKKDYVRRVQAATAFGRANSVT